MRTRLLAMLSTTVISLVVTLGVATPAHAVTRDEQITVAISWTQPAIASQQAWDAARLDQEKWKDFAFTWATDYCTFSPDQPLGFDFRLPCHRHDFGYRNFKALGIFSEEHRARIDQAFYFDMARVCDSHSSGVKQPCYDIAYLYYQAVRWFGGQVAQARINAVADQHGMPELITLTADHGDRQGEEL